ncbi:MAG: lysylphosphatidylglycerol synthase transmembrane domain-containing protein [Candidatus Zixiibacteriota bacterium]
MTASQRKTIYIVVGLVISGLLIWALFRNIDIAKLVTALKDAEYLWLIPNILMIVLTMYQRAYRWRFMLAPIKRVEFSNLLAATCIGFMANNVLPLRLGEFVRAYSLSSQDKGVTKSASLATIFVERMVFDLMALLVIFGAVISYSPSLRAHIQDNMVAATKLAIAIALIGLLAMLLLATKPSQIGNFLKRYLSFLPDKATDLLQSIIIKFSRGLEFLTDFRAVISVSVQTLLIWILMGLSNYFVFKVFGFNIPLDASFVLLVVVSVLILAPSTPGFLGVYHYGVVISLSVYGITDERALSCALVLHATQYVVVTLMGFYFLKKEHLTLKDLEKTAAAEI